MLDHGFFEPHDQPLLFIPLGGTMAHGQARGGGTAPRSPHPDGERGQFELGGTEAAGRVADVLLLFATGPLHLGVSEIARELGLSKAVVHRILQSLVSRSLLRADPGTREYRLGPGAIALGSRALHDLDLRQLAGPTLRRLRDVTRETTTLSGRVQDSRMYLDQYESPQEIKMTVRLGHPYPLHAGASSRAMLAFLPPAVVDRVVAQGMDRLTPETIRDEAVLRATLAEIRRSGYGTSLGERQHGAGSVAAPLFGVGGEVIGSLSVCGPVSRFDPASVRLLMPQVLAAADEISRQAGWDGGSAVDGIA
ncbi:IclR family transcriptional regulator [Rhodococcus antarcticus]|uniref:IclR family transcriptional regulator n=1 Tax=Rhodococcus antarcticus TaxID=2987751 RepID=A0ABY6NWA1_9NOCA|nr:IclR family transcriptional regulator [Rhodococcus antarcticus]UZJ23391.1 IclR family transcriptional regulator [Rhodococcus antarcticus]